MSSSSPGNWPCNFLMAEAQIAAQLKIYQYVSSYFCLINLPSFSLFLSSQATLHVSTTFKLSFIPFYLLFPIFPVAPTLTLSFSLSLFCFIVFFFSPNCFKKFEKNFHLSANLSKFLLSLRTVEKKNLKCHSNKKKNFFLLLIFMHFFCVLKFQMTFSLYFK